MSAISDKLASEWIKLWDSDRTTRAEIDHFLGELDATQPQDVDDATSFFIIREQAKHKLRLLSSPHPED